MGVPVAGAGGCGFGEEEGQEFVWDGEVRRLLELLEGEEAEEGFKEGKRGADGRERGVDGGAGLPG